MKDDKWNYSPHRFKDTLRPEAVQAIKDLKKLGINPSC